MAYKITQPSIVMLMTTTPTTANTFKTGWVTGGGVGTCTLQKLSPSLPEVYETLAVASKNNCTTDSEWKLGSTEPLLLCNSHC